ncbi:MAG: hypothetical protein QM774_06640 [Gordonia sp. (in: high G+C Gram-positive bacteria)]|uniref:hypothetical protein n=1 Tax=Gordonia sp. (in: high G+C Gram-positive bacteria) TaxID=84139 RepID=UPI0039E6F5C6
MSTPEDHGPDRSPAGYRPSSRQWMLVGAIAAFGAGFVLYKVLKHEGLGQSAALYVGIPLVLAAILSLTAPPRKATGVALRVTTLLLLLSVPVLGEGAICVLLTAPIFYLIVFAAAKTVDVVRDDDRKGPPGAQMLVAPAILVVLALEGTIPALTVPGGATSTATRVVDLPSTQMADALARPLDFGKPGGILALGFPDPMSDTGGLDVGSTRTIEFSGAHHRHGPTAQHHWGTGPTDLTLTVTGRTADSVTFTPAGDRTPLATWLRWDRIDVDWSPVDAGRTRVRWQLHYTRLLSPSWYFGPIERVVTTRAADYLIGSIDTRTGIMTHDHAS